MQLIPKTRIQVSIFCLVISFDEFCDIVHTWQFSSGYNHPNYQSDMEKYRAEGTFRPDNEQGDHIYEYLLKKRLPPPGGSSHGGTNRNETGRIKTNHRLPPSLPLPPPPPTSSGEDEIHELAPSLGKIRNSLSTSPSTEEDSSTNNTAERNQYQGKENFF